MELTKESIQSKNFIRNYENNMIYIGESCYKHDILISNDNLVKWELDNISNLSLDDLSDLFKLNPEIIIIGTGNKTIIPKKEIIDEVNKQEIGFEYMITDSACKTFNILLAEERRVVAGLHI